MSECWCSHGVFPTLPQLDLTEIDECLCVLTVAMRRGIPYLERKLCPSPPAMAPCKRLKLGSPEWRKYRSPMWRTLTASILCGATKVLGGFLQLVLCSTSTCVATMRSSSPLVFKRSSIWTGFPCLSLPLSIPATIFLHQIGEYLSYWQRDLQARRLCWLPWCGPVL